MTQQEQMHQNEQPVAGDSQPDKSLQTGGVTPDAEAVLAQLPADQARVLRSAIVEKNSRVEEVQRNLAQERKALEQDIEYAGIMRECMRDSDFAEFVNARESGDLATFYRQKAGVLNPVATNPQETSSLDSTVEPDVQATADVSSPQVAQISSRVQRLEAERARLAQEAAVQKFTQDHPDWEQYKTVMVSARKRLPHASLDDLYYAAKGMMADQASASGEAAPNTGLMSTGAGSANTAPPIPVGEPPGSTSPAPTVVRTMADALRAAKATHGISHDVAIKFEG